jgi:SAM-dependent methyltransferase
MRRAACINCRSADLHKFIDLGAQPNGNNFPIPGEEDREPVFPISMLVCQTCWQVQIDEFPPQEFLFADHPYVTGVNVPIVEHFRKLSRAIVDKLGIDRNSLIVDIGCNDGTLLRAFDELGMRTLGVDPGKRTGELARQQGTVVCGTFWNREVGQAFRKLNLRPDVITATAVFYHLPDLHDFIEGLDQAFHDRSVFVVQCVNLRDLIERNQFDHFYHEHSCIHSITALDRLFREHRMRLLDVDFLEVHGGSFVLYVVREDNPLPSQPSIQNALAAEQGAGLHDLETYEKFAQRVDENAATLRSLLTDLRDKGRRVYALGAPVKGNTLLNYAKVGPDLVQCATEVNEFKIGRLTPGTHIPIVHEKQLDRPPDYYLILSWNFLDYLIGKYRGYLLAGGRFIVPVPRVQVLGFEAVRPE